MFEGVERTYLNQEERTTYTTYHPAIRFKADEEFCFFPDEGTSSGLVEHANHEDALVNAEQLYKHYVLDKKGEPND